MGTRGSFGVRIDGENKLFYNHWDSYPTGLGRDLQKQINSMRLNWGMDEIRRRAKELRSVDEDSHPTEIEKRKYQQYADARVSSQSLDEWYVLLRNLQGDLVGTLEAGVGIVNNGFIKDSLFCEWAYILDLDLEILEVYTGFQSDGSGGYGPCKKIRDIPLAELEVFSEEEWCNLEGREDE